MINFIIIIKYILKIIIYNLFIIKPIIYFYTIYKNFSKNNISKNIYINYIKKKVEEYIGPLIDKLIQNEINFKILDVRYNSNFLINIRKYYNYKDIIKQLIKCRYIQYNKTSYIISSQYIYNFDINNKEKNFFLINIHFKKDIFRYRRVFVL